MTAPPPFSSLVRHESLSPGEPVRGPSIASPLALLTGLIAPTVPWPRLAFPRIRFATGRLDGLSYRTTASWRH